VLLTLSRLQGKRDICVRCQNILGFRSHEPDEEYWGFSGKLCKACYGFVKDSIQEYDASYIDGYSRLPPDIEGHLSILLFDERNTIVFTPKKKGYLPLQITSDLLADCKIINRNEIASLKRRLFTGGMSKSQDKRYLQIDFVEDRTNVPLVLDIYDKIDLASNTISLIKSTKTDESDGEGNGLEQDTSRKIELDIGQEQQQEPTMDQKTFCRSCETPNDLEARFCSKCGNKLFAEGTEEAPPPKPLMEIYNVDREKAYFKSEGEVIVRKTEHRGAGRKIASWLAAGPIGYVALGRDKTGKSKAKGTLIVTDKAIYCAGNVYPYDLVLAFTRKRKAILFLFEKSFNDQRFSVTLELRTGDTNGLFKALEIARTSHIKF
jgi:hypothetical protein